MIELTYDVNKIKIKSDDYEISKNTKQILITITLCTTALIGLGMYLECVKN